MWHQRVSSRYLNGHLPCLTPYIHKYNVSSVSLNKTFPSFLIPSETKMYKRFLAALKVKTRAEILDQEVLFGLSEP